MPLRVRRAKARFEFLARTFSLCRQRLKLAILALLIVFAPGADLARAEDPVSIEVYSVCSRRPALPLFADQNGKRNWRPKGIAFYWVAHTHLINGDNEKAFRQFDQAIDLDPDNHIFLMGRGMAHLRIGRDDQAIEDLDRAARLNPRSTLVFTWRANAHRARGDYQQAIDDANEAIRLFSGNAVAYTIRGTAHADRQEYDSALEAMNEAIKLAPDCIGGLMNRGLVYETKGEHDRAAADFDRVLEMSSAEAAFVFRARAYAAKRDYSRAVQELDQALNRDARNLTALVHRCFLRAVLGALNEALMDCNDALRERPNEAGVRATLGLVNLKKGAIDEAIAEYNSALRIAKRSAFSLYGRGTARRLKGDVAGGDADIAMAESIHPRVAEEMARYGIK